MSVRRVRHAGRFISLKPTPWSLMQPDALECAGARSVRSLSLLGQLSPACPLAAAFAASQSSASCLILAANHGGIASRPLSSLTAVPAMPACFFSCLSDTMLARQLANASLCTWSSAFATFDRRSVCKQVQAHKQTAHGTLSQPGCLARSCLCGFCSHMSTSLATLSATK